MERIASPSDLVVAVDLLREWLRRPDDDGLQRAFAEWVRRIAQRLVSGGGKFAAQMALEEVRMTVVERVSKWPKQWVREGREQGIREGLERGILCRFESLVGVVQQVLEYRARSGPTEISYESSFHRANLASQCTIR